ncbi:MAG: hypothetical protein HFI34_06485 [Lachnospiraceae bacterium]|nr:hypothetical protein [Lachnospiraceae bacterium]
MKKAEKDNPINTIPKGAYEAGATNRSIRNNDRNPNDITTDIQGNGYPVKTIKHENKQHNGK